MLYGVRISNHRLNAGPRAELLQLLLYGYRSYE